MNIDDSNKRKKTHTHDKVRLSWSVLLCLCSLNIAAEIKLPTMISDGMVMQRETPVEIWGKGDPGEIVNLSFSKNNIPVAIKGEKFRKSYSAITDKDGNWSIILPSLKHGGPYTMNINDKVLNDILIGDVWLCSGQSNMELPVIRVKEMFEDEINDYQNSNIRHIKIPSEYNFQSPQEDIKSAKWNSIDSNNVGSFSALAYFFAKEMYDNNNVPVGIINSSWGGTPVEAWMSEECLQKYPKYLHDKWIYQDDKLISEIKKTEANANNLWNRSLYKGDKGLHESPVWYMPEYNDNDWNNINMFSSDWGTNSLNPVNGSHWFRKEIEIPSSWIGKEAVLRLGCIVDADSVFVNGNFVGSISYQYPPRIYTVPAGFLIEGKNNITIRLISKNGYPHFVKDKPYKIICGDSEISLEGEWKYKTGAQMPAAPSTTFFNYKPVSLYNAMIAPLKNYKMSGVIWYQGESNVSRRNEYSALLGTMIEDWRNTFSNKDLPFYIIELADFLALNDPGRKAWAEMREEQAKVAEENKNVILIKNSDLGEWNDIHPLDKKTLGKRVAEGVKCNIKK